MKPSKSLYSECFSEYKLDDETLKKLQNCLLEIFLDIKNICDKYDIKYMLSGGSCLGALRHKGFIPWDDDIDIMMLRTEYEKFAKYFKEECSDKYILAEPLKQEKYFYKMPKIYKKGTKYIEIQNSGVNGPDMIFVDIFILENVPKSKLKRKIYEKIYNIGYGGASTCIDYLYPAPVMLEKSKTNDELKKYYRTRRRLGFIFSHIGGIKFWLKTCDKIAQKYKNKSTGFIGLLSGISYGKEIFEERVYTELIDADFCGYKVKIPKYYDEYLSNVYGDYMKLPPIEKREVHIVYKIEF